MPSLKVRASLVPGFGNLNAKQFLFLIKFYLFIYLSIYFRLCSVLIARQTFSRWRQRGLVSSCSVRAFSLQWLFLLRLPGSRAQGRVLKSHS